MLAVYHLKLQSLELAPSPENDMPDPTLPLNPSDLEGMSDPAGWYVVLIIHFLEQSSHEDVQ